MLHARLGEPRTRIDALHCHPFLVGGQCHNLLGDFQLMQLLGHFTSFLCFATNECGQVLEAGA